MLQTKITINGAALKKQKPINENLRTPHAERHYVSGVPNSKYLQNFINIAHQVGIPSTMAFMSK